MQRNINGTQSIHGARASGHENARQLSGYAHRTALREKYLEPPAEDFLCPCVVIYPSSEGLTTLKNAPDRWLRAPSCGETLSQYDDEAPAFSALQQVKEYQKFYKLPIHLPVK